MTLDEVRMYLSKPLSVPKLTRAAATDYNYDLSTGESASALLSQFERKRMAARLAVPTNDVAVKAALRERGVPITLFGENSTLR